MKISTITDLRSDSLYHINSNNLSFEWFCGQNRPTLPPHPDRQYGIQACFESSHCGRREWSHGWCWTESLAPLGHWTDQSLFPFPGSHSAPPNSHGLALLRSSETAGGSLKRTDVTRWFYLWWHNEICRGKKRKESHVWDNLPKPIGSCTLQLQSRLLW